jgi:hypothetical protein
MSLTVSPRPADGPDAGVIEEARRRQRRRRGTGTAFGGLAAIVAGALWLGGGGHGGSPGSGGANARGRLTGRPARLTLVHGRAFIGGQPAPVSVEPSLQAGNVGVCIRVSGEGGSCNGPPPTADDPIYGGEGGYTVQEKVGPTGEINALFSGARVAAVRVAHLGTFAAQHAAGLPPGAKEVLFYRPPGARGSVIPPGISPRILQGFAHGRQGPALTETLLSASGRAIPVSYSRTFTLPNSYWQGAAAPPADGRCAMSSSFTGAKTLWGQVTQQIAADRAITVPAWLTCLHVWYSAGSAAFETAILLNAKAPGSPPAPLWGAIPVPGHPGIVQIPPVQREIHFRFPKFTRAQVARQLAEDVKTMGPLGRAHARADAQRYVSRMLQLSGKEQTHWEVLVPPAVARRVGPAWLLVRYGNSLAQRIAFLQALHLSKIALSPTSTRH